MGNSGRAPESSTQANNLTKPGGAQTQGATWIIQAALLRERSSGVCPTESEPSRCGSRLGCCGISQFGDVQTLTYQMYPRLIVQMHRSVWRLWSAVLAAVVSGAGGSWSIGWLFTIGTRSDADLVNSMLDAAIDTVALSSERPVVHSDRGAHYRWPGWLTRSPPLT